MPNHGAGGRPAKPAELHRLEGTGREERGNDIVLSIASANETVHVDAPEWLTEVNSQIDNAEYFDKFHRMVQRVFVHSDVDAHVVAMLISQYDIYVQAQQRVLADGIDATVGPKDILAVYVMDKTMKNIIALLREYGLTPSARTGKIKDQPEQDPMKDFLNELHG